MPQIYELNGYPVDDRSTSAEETRKSAMCPFTDSRCDGGGNRNQTAIDLDDDEELAEYFDDTLDRVIPGVCSIDYGEARWIVCPRRLMGFKHDGEDLPPVNDGLQPHERRALVEGGLPQDRELGVWPEVYLRYSDDDADINYHFDFVVAPLEMAVPLGDIFADVAAEDPEEQEEIIEAARSGGEISGRISESTRVHAAPRLTCPYIVEVMTASTSGSNRRLRTDIASAFTDALLDREHTSPGINKRQVWGRMATQLFAKSALAEAWDGRALWVVQDRLLEDIEQTTQLAIGSAETASDSTVNFTWMGYADRGDDRPTLVFRGHRRIKAGLDYLEGGSSCAGILLPKKMPPKSELLKGMLRSQLAARLVL